MLRACMAILFDSSRADLLVPTGSALLCICVHWVGVWSHESGINILLTSCSFVPTGGGRTSPLQACLRLFDFVRAACHLNQGTDSSLVVPEDLERVCAKDKDMYINFIAM